MKIGIIGAMDIEVKSLISSMDNVSKEIISDITFYHGTLYGKDLTVAKCGPGKVNAAVCAQTMILKYEPDVILNTGVAGGIGSGIKILDMVISDYVVQHDIDTSAFGDPLGYISGLGIVKIASSKSLVDKIKLSAESLKNTNVFVGTIATGEQFVGSLEHKKKIYDNFNALCVEMEGAAIGHACYMNGTDFCIIRSISDNADGSAATLDYPAFVKKAAEKSIELIHSYVKSC